MTGSVHTNLEIKARCPGLAPMRERARRVATVHVGLDRQTDTYFRTGTGRLKLRESSLAGGQLIPYLRPDTPGPRRSAYRVIPVSDPESLRDLLGRILGVHRVVRKEREIFLYENVRIHLDRVEGLGSFVELEAQLDGREGDDAAARGRVAFLVRELGIQAEHLVAGSYEGLFAAED